MLMGLFIVFVGMLRYIFISYATASMTDSSKLDVSYLKTSIVNQHIWLLLFLSYLVLPPVTMKQLQGLDCIPFHHDNSAYLRVDTGVNCQSDDYYYFKVIDILFFCLYQLIPLTWMFLLYRNRAALHVATSSNMDEALTQRDEDRSLSHLKFLFKDYKGTKWWFEVAEMYRRIMFIGVLPLFTPNSSKRASLGCIFAIISLVYFREEEPFRVAFTNNIACIAQVMLKYLYTLSVYVYVFTVHVRSVVIF
jgi:hypothetical protein